MTGSTRNPQQERSRLTRKRLLSSTIAVLAGQGWAAATVATVAEKAGVSRGAAQHHFATREALITAALEQLFEDLTASAAVMLATMPEGPERVGVAVERAVEIYAGTEFKAALQVWAAAASDPALRTLILPLEARFGAAAHQLTMAALGAEPDDERAHRGVQVTLDLARGLGLADTLSDDSKRRAQVVATWAEMLRATLYPPA
ncbi:TetR/AcrR family transcriptional regulator [Gordonia sp. ABSL1-1]|uniref:TetR/AcrR family transcriptional regulator n=1 Tax=Gordonia sp. ABSL1-1 TaxID=3053923 RepID=UPI0025722F2D|nr:TetR/AcrR family transcriptional regulator [Gordonia sp. ABSL1-1]MDL9937869.1 TetR/AcrR family transcriptional regulator [Gordonia sp. ABSL1-1]